MNDAVPPRSTSDLSELPANREQRRSTFVETFGRWLFWHRNRSLRGSRKLVESEELRNKLGTIRRTHYDSAAAMSPAEREVALVLAQQTLDDFIERLAWSLGDEGTDCRLDDRHAYRFRIDIEIVDADSGAIIEQEPINRGGSFFGKNWGRWLNKFGTE